jgi:arsenate reductase (glutaredoxin)
MIKIYHNPRCAKSREGLQYLIEHGIPFEVIKYLERPMAAEVLKTLLMKLNMKPVQVIRTQEELYRRELKGRNFTDEEWIDIIIQNPRLMQRPIVESKYKAVVAIPPILIHELLNK